MVGLSDKIFKSEDVYLIGVFEMFFESASGVEVTELPSFPTKNEIRLGVFVAGVEDRLNQADDFEGDFLFGSTRNDLSPRTLPR